MNALRKFLALAALGLAAFNTAATAQTGPRGQNIMIIGLDDDNDAIKRGNRNFDLIQGVIGDQLKARGFHVVDESAIPKDALPGGRLPQRISSLLDLARRPGEPIDVLVVTRAFASVRPADKGDFQPVIRVEGRIISVRTGETIGSYDSYDSGPDVKLPPIPGACMTSERARECLQESVGNGAKVIASLAGNGLADRLALYISNAGQDPSSVPGGGGPR